MRTGLFFVLRDRTLHDPLDLLLTPDDGVELVARGKGGEVAAELVEDGGSAGRGLLAGALLLRAAVPGQELDDLLAHTAEISAQLLEDLGSNAFALPDEPEKDVLGADVVVAKLQRFTQRQLQHLLRSGREGDVALRRGGARADDLLDLLANSLQGDPQGLQRLRSDTLPLGDKPEKDVLGADVVVVEESRLF